MFTYIWIHAYAHAHAYNMQEPEMYIFTQYSQVFTAFYIHGTTNIKFASFLQLTWGEKNMIMCTNLFVYWGIYLGRSCIKLSSIRLFPFL